ncbi:hypothetical protein [Actinomadura rubrisoli]|uniref:Uncharacterized protein n=1 Tax=Actinomadura rubrisoli TaxID=2530368 RepID=A0A4R5CDT3_9ACTN|nr:hypothetical protein [Actinomadura rubrisoli]TDD95322.1 hypothetical protein E1298_05520 [Actinomadura rubrisoli]
MSDLQERPVALRVLLAGVVGGGLVLVAVLVAFALAAAVPCHGEGWDCLGWSLLIGFGCLAGAAVASWPALWWVGVRPALPVAAVGVVLSILVGWLSVEARLPVGFAVPGFFLFALVGFAAAALVCGRGIARPWRIGGIVTTLLLLLGLRLVAAFHDGQARDDYLADAGVPLLAPDLPGYVIKDPSAAPGAFRYTLLPAGLVSVNPAVDGYTVATSSISVGVLRLPAGFAPPKRCNWDSYAQDLPCTAAGPDLWRRSEDARSVLYLARKNSVLVTVSQTSDTPDEKTLRRIARTLAPHPASRFRPSPS